MADRSDFDPTAFLQDEVTLAAAADGASVAALKLQSGLHRQRLAAARRRAEIARIRGDAATVATLEPVIAARADRAEGAEAQFALANISVPLPAEGLARLAVAVLGETDAPPLCVAVLSPEGAVLAEEKVSETGAAILAFESAREGIRLQVHDGQSRIRHRDAAPFDAPLGAVTERVIRLSGPVEACAPAPTELRMPDLVGQSEDVACAALWRLGLREIDREPRPDDGPAGLVLEQAPEPGAALSGGTAARLVISAARDTPAPEGRDMPDFLGRPVAEVRVEARRLGIALSVTEAASPNAPSDIAFDIAFDTDPDGVAPGTVIGQDPPPGTPLRPPFAARIAVVPEADPSDPAPEPQGIQVPPLIGRDIGTAREIAAEAGIGLAVSTLASGRPEGEVIRQAPAPGATLPVPLTVSVTVSAGPAERDDDTNENRAGVTVPRLTGRQIADARAVAAELGFGVATRAEPGDAPTGTVLRQAPQAGAVVPLPATLTLTVADLGVDRDREEDGTGDGTGDGEDGRFRAAVMRAARADGRLARVDVDADALEGRLAALGVTDAATLDALIALDNGAMAERLALPGRGAARTVRAVLREAAERVSY